MLQAHDPDRFGMALAAPSWARSRLVTLYALNVELARAPFQSTEPMLALMRLQWWVERLAEMGAGTAPPAHDVLVPLWDAWGDETGQMVPLAEARQRDCDRQPFAETDQVVAHIDATAGTLMRLAAHALGVPPRADGVIADQARVAGITAWLRALPQLQQLHLGILDPAAPAQLAQIGLDAFAAAHRQRHLVPKLGAAALFAGPAAGSFLTAMRKGADPLIAGPVSPFRRRGALVWLAMTGRWWV